MSSIDRPRPPDGAQHPDAPELVRVGRVPGTRQTLLIAAAVAVLLGAAVWKPWEPGRAPVLAGGTPIAGASGGLLPPSTSGPAPSVVADALRPDGPRQLGPFVAGLNLAIMGTADPHRAWGVAIAYVPRNQIDNAILRRGPTVTPVVSWELMEPGRPAPGPTLDHPDVVSVAIAATWPVGTRPLAIRLLSFPARPSSPGLRPSSGLVPAREIQLGEPLAARVHVAAGEIPPTGFESGAFYLPRSITPDEPLGWLGNGWPAGAYALDVELERGVRATLPFTLGSDGA